MRMFGVMVVLGVSVAWLSGCSQGVERQKAQTRLITNAGVDEVFDAAQVVLRREFGPLKVMKESRQIVSRPVKYRTSSESGTARDLYGGRSTMRKIAHFAAVPRDTGVLARLRIEIERQDTERQEVFQPDRSRRLSDAPSDTPIERDAATTTRQNTVWTFVKRDYRLERALLAEIQEKFAPPPADEPAGASEKTH